MIEEFLNFERDVNVVDNKNESESDTNCDYLTKTGK